MFRNLTMGAVAFEFRTIIVLGCGMLATARGQDALPEFLYTNEQLGIKLTLPDATWKMSDHSQGHARVLVISPDDKLVTRCSILYLPKGLLPEGILSREKQLQAMLPEGYERLALKDVKFCDRDARELTYRIAKSRTVEIELEEKDAILIFQLAALETFWDDPQISQSLQRIRDSFQFSGAKRIVADTTVASVEEIRSQRQVVSTAETSPFEVRHHELHVDIQPSQHALRVRDRLTLRAKVADLRRVTLYVSEVAVDEVMGPAGLTWEVRPRENSTWEDATVNALELTFSDPLPLGEDRTVQILAHSDDFLHEIDQQLVAEIAVLGQVRERSSYSSHVLYYPVDEHQGGSMDVTLTVPAGMTAVTGGRLVSTTTQDGRQAFRYRTEDGRARLLPFGFAAGEYIRATGVSQGGLRLTFYGYPGEERLLQQRVSAGVEAANIFETWMGPLPWDDVRFAHVTPIRKETGVSLPGLVLISDAFFTDFESVDLSSGNLAERDLLSLLVIADELSHQWNAYAVPLPNQLAEGVSTFTNILFLEQRAGKQAAENAVRYCRDAYITSTSLGKDVAIADPAIYQTAAYRGIAFTKTAVVLSMLREHVGDDIFFAGWREAFGDFDEHEDGFVILEKAFAKAADDDLKWFFDQWLYRPGWAKLRINYQQEGSRLSIECQQIQSGGPFRMPVKLRARGVDGQTRQFTLQLNATTTTAAVECPFSAEIIDLDPDGFGLVTLVDG